MESNLAAKRKFSGQRQPRPAPHIPLAALRVRLGFRLVDVAVGVEEITGDSVSIGTLSAIENGHRGGSRELLRALEMVYGLEPGCIATTYVPRPSPAPASA